MNRSDRRRCGEGVSELRQLQSLRITRRQYFVCYLLGRIGCAGARAAPIADRCKALLTTRRDLAKRLGFGDRFNRIAMSRC
jgi:hypothetical protein